MLGPLDVIWIHDGTIRPPGPKMVVCVQAELGFFFRINSEGNWQNPVKLDRHPHHLFLRHDSYLECGEPLDLDEYIVEQSLDDKGVIGTLHTELVTDILASVWEARLISETDKREIETFLRPSDLSRLNSGKS